MGNYINKFLAHNEDFHRKVKVDDSNQISSPNPNEIVVHTPPTRQRRFTADPRSITAEICRTPVEVQGTPGITKSVVSAIPKYLQRKPYLETDIDIVMPPLTPKTSIDPRSPNSVFPRTPILMDDLQSCTTPHNNTKKFSKIISSVDDNQLNILGLDPRSPATDFDRTPILNTKSLRPLRSRSQENIHSPLSYDKNAQHPRFSYCETTVPFNIPEIQVLPNLSICLDKCHNTSDINHSNELDNSQSSHSSSSASIETISQSEEEITVIRNIHNLPDNRNNVWKIFETNEEKSLAELRTDPKRIDGERSQKDRIKIWRDSLSSERSTEIEASSSIDDEFDNKKTALAQKEDMIIIFDDDTVIRNALPSKVTTNDCENKKTDPIGRRKKVSQCENDLTMVDRKKLFSPDGKIVSEVQKCRTPLGNRSNNGQKQELATKSPQHVLRSTVMSVKRYQENTPPQKVGVVKSRINGIQWDPDSTVII